MITIYAALALLAKFYCVFAVANVVYKYVVRRRWLRAKVKALAAVPGPTLSPNGRELMVNMHRWNDFRLEHMREYGWKKGKRTIKIVNPGIEIMTTDPAVVKHILKDAWMHYTKPPPSVDYMLCMFQTWLGRDGIFALQHGARASTAAPLAPEDHAKWHAQRKTAAGIFTRRNFKALMRDTFVDKAGVVVELLEGAAARHAARAAAAARFAPARAFDGARAGCVFKLGAKGLGYYGDAPQPARGDQPDGAVDMQRYCFAFTMDSIQNIFFGRNTETLRDERDSFAAAFDEAHRAMMKFFFGNIVALVVGGRLPWPLGTMGAFFAGPTNFANALRRLHPDGRRFDRAVATLTAGSRRIIAERRAAMARDPAAFAKKKDLLALFLAGTNEAGCPYTDEHLRDILLSFIIAGRDTTACTLTWCLFILATHPEVQAKLQAEVDAADHTAGRHRSNSTASAGGGGGDGDNGGRGGDGDTGGNGADAAPTYASVSPSRMPYLHGVVMEALRLYPPVPEDPKMCTAKDGDVLPDGTRVPYGVRVMYHPYAMGRDPERYAPDPEAVRPERWHGAKEPSPHAFPVFQAGPRICLGQAMAKFETKLLLTMLVRRFAFALRAGEAEKITYSLTVTMALCNSKQQDSHNLWVVPTPRKHE